MTIYLYLWGVKMDIVNSYHDPKLYMMLIINGFLNFLVHIAKVDLSEICLSIENNIEIVTVDGEDVWRVSPHLFSFLPYRVKEEK